MDEYEPITCPMCLADQPEMLGQLGESIKLRCRCCGWLWGVLAEDLPEEDVE